MDGGAAGPCAARDPQGPSLAAQGPTPASESSRGSEAGRGCRGVPEKSYRDTESKPPTGSRLVELPDPQAGPANPVHDSVLTLSVRGGGGCSLRGFRWASPWGQQRYQCRCSPEQADTRGAPLSRIVSNGGAERRARGAAAIQAGAGAAPAVRPRPDGRCWTRGPGASVPV